MIEIREVHKSFGANPLFRGVSLSVRRGEVVALIGPSGSGKSTLLRCVNGLEPIQGGEIEVDGTLLRPVPGRPGRRERDAVLGIRRKIGMVFQQFNLFPHMTVLENILEAPTRVLRLPREEAVERALELLRRIHLERKVDSYPGTLSGGEQQRVAIARALAMRPEAMLFDEPTSSLDPETVGEVLAVVRDLVETGLTTMIATHEMEFAEEIADRVAVFDHGEIVETGSAEKIFSDPSEERTRTFLRRVLNRRRPRISP